MKYLDKNGNAHNSAACMRLADIRSTNIVEAVKEVTGMICDKAADIINSRPKFGDDYADSTEDLMFEEDSRYNYEEIEDIDSDEPQNRPEVCITREEPEEGTITNIWYNINLRQWQFEESGNPSIVIKTLDEMTPEFTQAVYNRTDVSLRRGEKLLVNLMFSIANEELPDLAERSHYINITLSATDVHALGALISTRASLGLRIVGEVPPSKFGTISDGHLLGQLLTESIIALQTGSGHIRRET